MNKCNNCNHIFTDDEMDNNIHNNIGENIPDGGFNEFVNCCPNCKTENDFDEVNICKKCGKSISVNDWEYHYGWCHDCAKKEFDLEKGMKYLKSTDCEKDYYIEECYYSTINVADDSLISLCRKEFINRCNPLNIELHQNTINHFKNWIFEDITSWIEFLNSEEGI